MELKLSQVKWIVSDIPVFIVFDTQSMLALFYIVLDVFYFFIHTFQKIWREISLDASKVV